MKAAFALSAIMATIATALPAPSNVVSSTLSSTSGLTSVSKDAHSVMTIVNKTTNKKFLVQLEKQFGSLSSLTGGLASVTDSVGSIVDTASDPSKLTSNGASGLITVALGQGEFALVELTGTVEGLLSSLGLGEISTVVGSVVSEVEAAASSAKRDSNLLSLTGLNGEKVLAKATGLLSNVDLTSLSGSVLKEVPMGTDLESTVKGLAVNPTQVLSVLSKDGASTLLVKVEGLTGELTSTVGGLLKTLGLGDLSTTAATVVSTVEGAASSVKRDSNLLSLTGLNGEKVLAKATGLLSNVDLTSLSGSVLKEVPMGTDLEATVKQLAVNPTQVLSLLSEDGASTVLVKVEGLAGELTSTVGGLLKTLGLGDLTSTVGQVVSGVEGVASQ